MARDFFRLLILLKLYYIQSMKVDTGDDMKATGALILGHYNPGALTALLDCEEHLQ